MIEYKYIISNDHKIKSAIYKNLNNHDDTITTIETYDQ